MTAAGRAAVAVLFALAFLAGLTADAWNPCAGDHVCVVVAP